MPLSVARRLHLRAKQGIYLALCVLFRVDRWHARVVRDNCGYFARVRTIHDELAPTVTIEVGCGLGEILSGLDSRLRIGVDRDLRVLRLARLMRGRAIHFVAADEFPEVAAGIAPAERVCLVMLNWLHVCEPAAAMELMSAYVRSSRASCVVFDVIDAAAAGYRVKHDPQTFAGLGTIESVCDGGDGIRRIVTLRVDGAGAP